MSAALITDNRYRNLTITGAPGWGRTSGPRAHSVFRECPALPGRSHGGSAGKVKAPPPRRRPFKNIPVGARRRA